jgi:hypothetical protein
MNFKKRGRMGLVSILLTANRGTPKIQHWQHCIVRNSVSRLKRACSNSMCPPFPTGFSPYHHMLKTKVRLFLKHKGLCGGDETIHTSRKRSETPLQNEERTIEYFYRDHENIHPRNSSPAASTFLSPGRLSKRDAGLNDITAQYSNKKKWSSSGMMHADHSSISSTPINTCKP